LGYNDQTTYDVAIGLGATAGATGAGVEYLAPGFDILEPLETPWISTAPKRKATAVNHEFMRDDYAAGTSNASIEGREHEVTTAQDFTRYRNYTQIMSKDIQVTTSMQKTMFAGNIGKILAYQKMKAMKQLKVDMEWNFFQSTSSSGASGTARKMIGIISALSAVGSNFSTSSGQRALDKTLFDAVALLAYTDGAKIDKIYVSPQVKMLLAQLVSSTFGTRFIAGGEKGQVIQTVDVIESDLGVYPVIIDRQTTTNTIVMLESARWRRAVLDPVQFRDIGVTGLTHKSMIFCEETLEYHPDAGGLLEDIS
jgi:hypothetical protein